jgi:hypothetical protein
MSGLQLFEIQIADRASGASMTLEGGRDFDRGFYLIVDGATWRMSVSDASWLAAGARQIENRVQWAKDRAKEGATFRRHVPFTDGTLLVELGIEHIGDDDVIYFEFDKRIQLASDDARRLFDVLARFGDDVRTVRSASGGVTQLNLTQQISRWRKDF